MVSRLTVIVLQSRDVRIVPTLANSGKWGWETRFKDDPDHPPYVSHAAVFEDRDAAKVSGEETLRQIKGVDLSGFDGERYRCDVCGESFFFSCDDVA
jgi:hypothetical protein